MTTSIHISDVRTFRTCRRRWKWSSALGRNLEPVVPYVPFFTGRAVHHCLEMYYGPRHVPLDKSLDKFLEDEKTEIDKIGVLWPQEEITFAEQIEMMRGILGHYRLWVEHDHKMYSDENLEFVGLETEFDVPMLTPSGRRVSKKMRLGGRFDGVVKHVPTGEYWIWECKTTRSVQELVNSLANDEQCGAYIYAASKMYNIPIAGVLYNIIRKKVPTTPDLLQSGMLSLATKVDCTAFFYVRCIRQMYPDWSDDTIQGFYGPLLEFLMQKEQAFFLRLPVYRTEFEVRELMRNIYYTACEMVRSTVKLYPAPGWLNCTMCPFRSPCLAVNAGSDYEVLLEAEYQQRASTRSVRNEESSTDERA